jgi:hypothetical protein
MFEQCLTFALQPVDAAPATVFLHGVIEIFNLGLR